MGRRESCKRRFQRPRSELEATIPIPGKVAMAMGILVCFALALLPAVGAGGADFGGEGKLLLPSHRLKLPRQVSKIRDPLLTPSARKLHQSDVPLCQWDEGECGAAFWLDAPDDTIAKISDETEVCENITAIDECFAQDCVWDEGACGEDFVTSLKDCIVPEYFVFFQYTQCLGSQESTCDYLPECEWDATDASCAGNSTSLKEAIASSPELSEAFLQQQECLQSDTCVAPCVEEEACTYPKLADISQWFLPKAISTFCEFTKLQFGCKGLPAENSECSGVCFVDEEGDCSVRKTAVVEKVFEGSEVKRDKWLDALEACAAIEDPDECGAFTGA